MVTAAITGEARSHPHRVEYTNCLRANLPGQIKSALPNLARMSAAYCLIVTKKLENEEKDIGEKVIAEYSILLTPEQCYERDELTILDMKDNCSVSFFFVVFCLNFVSVTIC
jgi:hypothetical protein